MKLDYDKYCKEVKMLYKIKNPPTNNDLDIYYDATSAWYKKPTDSKCSWNDLYAKYLHEYLDKYYDTTAKFVEEIYNGEEKAVESQPPPAPITPAPKCVLGTRTVRIRD
jgi:hypothetical protein